MRGCSASGVSYCLVELRLGGRGRYVCNCLFCPGTRKGCPMMLYPPKTNVGAVGKPVERGCCTRRNYVHFRVRVRNLGPRLSRSAFNRVDHTFDDQRGNCLMGNLSDHRGCCVGQICLTYIHDVSLLASLPR